MPSSFSFSLISIIITSLIQTNLFFGHVCQKFRLRVLLKNNSYIFNIWLDLFHSLKLFFPKKLHSLTAYCFCRYFKRICKFQHYINITITLFCYMKKHYFSPLIYLSPWNRKFCKWAYLFIRLNFSSALIFSSPLKILISNRTATASADKVFAVIHIE